MIVANAKVNPVVRVVANLLVAATLGGTVAYLSWLLTPIPEWFAIIVGTSVVVVYCLMWFGSMDDSRNA